MLRMSLINVAVKSGPPSPCPFCCSVLVPLQCPQSQEQIVTLMMDIQPPPPPPASPHTAPRLVSGHRPPSLRSPGTAERGSQPVRQPCSPHQFRESRRQPRILTSLALTSSGGDAAQFRRLSKTEEASWGHGGSQQLQKGDDATPDCCCAQVFTAEYFWALTLQTAMVISELRGHSASCLEATQQLL